MISIVLPDGTSKTVKIGLFKALDGWDIQAKFVSFAASSDKSFRREFTLEVLSYASVCVSEDMEIPLVTDAVINNHLMTWENVQNVFEEVLRANGIDPTTHANKTIYWANAGAEMAVAFIAEASKLIAPAMAMYESALASDSN